MKKYDIAVIGAGASGFCAAIEAARNNGLIKIVLLDRMPRAGKKILVTGNGRCNMTNINATAEKYNNALFVSSVFQKFDVLSNLNFFESMGLLTFHDSEGRVYPMSNTASSVIDVLRFEAERLGVDTMCDFRADEIRKHNSSFVINGEIEASAVIIACGGKAAPVHGSDGSGYRLLEAMGHKITSAYPSLVQIKTEQDFVKQLKGIRINAKLAAMSCGVKIAESDGEILFADYGISGIAAMEISKFAAMHCRNDCYIELDMLPQVSFERIIDVITKICDSNPSLPLENLLVGLLPKRLGQAVCKEAADLKLNEPVSSLSKCSINSIANTIKHKKIKITGTNGFDQAQVTAGGADTSSFNSDDLSSKLCRGLFACGEILDIDSGCGGFNLQWAWSSGRLAGISAAKAVRKKKYD